LLVTNSRRDELVVLDARTMDVERRIPVGRIPKDLEVSADGSTAYVAHWGGGSLGVVDLAACIM
jgi:YVTN family beta-propeller protein